jgi:fido (protein-threonine AMPylation protein)
MMWAAMREPVLQNIHPYMDGNGRMGRFLMNTMMAAGGYPLDDHPRRAP